MSRSHDLQIKLLMIGDSGVGKTCLLLRYGQNQFSPTFITTIGIDFKVKYIDIGGKRVKLQIWDTAGQERFRTITTSYFRGAHGIVLVYDITDRESFEHVDIWMSEIHRNADKYVNKILVGNKADKEEDREVQYAEGQALADKYGIKFYETSAKTSDGVAMCFEDLAATVKDRLEKSGAASTPVVKTKVSLVNRPTEDKKSCCK